MQARRKTGQYKSHHTPGDGTGLDRLPEKETGNDILTDVNPKGEVHGQPYECQVTTDEKE